MTVIYLSRAFVSKHPLRIQYETVTDCTLRSAPEKYMIINWKFAPYLLPAVTIAARWNHICCHRQIILIPIPNRWTNVDEPIHTNEHDYVLKPLFLCINLVRPPAIFISAQIGTELFDNKCNIDNPLSHKHTHTYICNACMMEEPPVLAMVGRAGVNMASSKNITCSSKAHLLK